jgi:hypothetical protein
MINGGMQPFFYDSVNFLVRINMKPTPLLSKGITQFRYPTLRQRLKRTNSMPLISHATKIAAVTLMMSASPALAVDLKLDVENYSSSDLDLDIVVRSKPRIQCLYYHERTNRFDRIAFQIISDEPNTTGRFRPRIYDARGSQLFASDHRLDLDDESLITVFEFTSFNHRYKSVNYTIDGKPLTCIQVTGFTDDEAQRKSFVTDDIRMVIEPKYK